METAVNNILEQVAAQNHVSLEEVRREIGNAIADAFASEDPAVKAKWKLLAPEGIPPTPEKLIMMLALICRE